MNPEEYDLIVTVVRMGWADRVLEAAKLAGAEGATILGGRGMGVHEQKKILGIPIEPEKEIILTLITSDKTEGVLARIIEEADLDKPATGIVFVVKVSHVAGIVHARSWPPPMGDPGATPP